MHYNIALIGFGGVNRGLVEILEAQSEKLTKTLGFSLNIVAVSDLFQGSVYRPEGIDLTQLKNLPIEKGSLAAISGGSTEADNENIIKNSNADIIVEATITDAKTGEPASTHCAWALAAGKHVSTTNKGPVALAAKKLIALAEQHHVAFEYEGVVMSGTPVLRFAQSQLKGNKTASFQGILNGTANYVLEQMEQGSSLNAAITKAQDLGYAEANPAADIEGGDARLKVVILANSLFGCDIGVEDVGCAGITCLTPEIVEQAVKENCHWKLVGQARQDKNGKITACVAPQKLSGQHPLAGISGATNAVSFQTDLLGSVTISGPGAGRIETAYAVLSDIISIDQKFGHKSLANKSPERKTA